MQPTQSCLASLAQGRLPVCVVERRLCTQYNGAADPSQYLLGEVKLPHVRWVESVEGCIVSIQGSNLCAHDKEVGDKRALSEKADPLAETSTKARKKE